MANWLKSFGQAVVAAACLFRDPLFCLISPSHLYFAPLYTIPPPFLFFTPTLQNHGLCSAFSLQVSTSREPQFSSTVANFFRLRKPSDTFLPDNQHPTGVSQYSTTHRFSFFPFTKAIQEFSVTCKTHLCKYCTTHRFSFSFYKVF